MLGENKKVVTCKEPITFAVTGCLEKNEPLGVEVIRGLSQAMTLVNI